MKTKSSARGTSRIWVVVVCLAIAGIAGVEARVGDSLAAQFRQAAARQTEGPQAPNVDISDVISAASLVR